jgi:hypothetical protein
MEKFFIVGCPRSGTTMLQQALNRHSQVVIPPETKFFFSFFGHCRKCQLRHLERLNEDLDIRIPAPPGPVCSVADGRAFYELMARLYVERLEKRGVVCFGEKTPEHTGHLHRIRQLFPTAKILVLYRDGRDVAVSLSKMPWMSPDLYVNFLVWHYFYRIVSNAQNKSNPNIYFARYEDIVAAPEEELGKILHFLGLRYEAAVALGYGNAEGVPVREYAWKSRALQKITTERVGVFRRELSPGQIEILERMGRRSLESLGYQLVTDGKRPLSVGFLLHLSGRIWKFINRLPLHAIANELFGRGFLCPGQGHGLYPSLVPSQA